jgi:uncharacterized protein
MSEFELCIVKVASFCNINCSYCYMFNASDRTFERVPRFMSEQTSLQLLDRITEYLGSSDSKRFHVTLHGGEPSLWPKPNFRRFLGRIRELNRTGYRLSVSMQTNGFRYDPALFEILAEHNVTVGVSLDGPREYNDRRRVTHRGTGSYDRIMANVEKILRSPSAEVLQGFLAVADPSIAPAAFVDWVGSLPITKLDLLWPMDFSYVRPPWRDGAEAEYRASPTYGRWFADVFDAWMAKDDPDIYIRHFFDCIEYYMGSSRHIESIVNDCVPMFVVNTDGQYEYHDYFRPHADGVCRTSANLSETPIAVLHDDPLFRELLALAGHLPPECRGCDVAAICGGGFLPGRTGGPADMPRSVLCHDQGHFFAHVRNWLERRGIALAAGRAVSAAHTQRPLIFGHDPSDVRPAA